MSELIAPDAHLFPASPGQERLWFLDRMNESASNAYSLAVRMDLRGTVALTRLQAALSAVVDRHEALFNLLCLNAGDPAAIHTDHGAGDVSGTVAGQERDHIGIFFRLAVTAERNAARALGRNVLHGAAFALGFHFVEEFDAARCDAPGKNNV